MKLFEKLAATAGKAAIDKAYAKGLMRCPNCGRKPTQAPVDAETLLRCAACGFDGLPHDWRPDPLAVATGKPDQIPAGTGIQREGRPPGDCVWQIPSSGKFGFFLYFGIFWTAITAVVSGGFLLGSSAEQPAAQPWFIYPFFGVFWAVGIGCLYAAVRNKYARHRITVTRDRVTLCREMFGRAREKSLLTPQVMSVAQVVFYQQNYQPVYGVEIRGRGGKLRFGTTLDEAEKAWLVADIKRAVFGESATAPPATAASAPGIEAAQRQSSFAFPLPPAPKWHWVLGLVLVLISLGGLALGIFNRPSFPSHLDGRIDWFELVFACVFNLFSLIPIIVGLVFGVVGVGFLSTTWPGRQREVRLEGNEWQVVLRTYQQGRVIKEQSFQRSSVREVRATRSGDVNGRPMKRIDLIVDGKAKPLTRWTAGDVADAWVTEVCGALGRPAGR